jgi:hypothetical protein
MLEELDNVLLVQDLSGLRKSFLLQPDLLPAELFLPLLSLSSAMGVCGGPGDALVFCWADGVGGLSIFDGCELEDVQVALLRLVLVDPALLLSVGGLVADILRSGRLGIGQGPGEDEED